MKVEEYRVLPELISKKTKSGSENLRPQQLVRVRNTIKERESWLLAEGEPYSYAVHKGLPKW